MHSVITSSLHLKPFADLFSALGIARAHILVDLGRRGGNISVDLSLFVLLYNANAMSKLKFKD